MRTCQPLGHPGSLVLLRCQRSREGFTAIAFLVPQFLKVASRKISVLADLTITGPRILVAAKQTIVVFIKKSGNNWPFSIIL